MADRKPMPGQSVALTQTQLKGVITRLKEWPLERVLQIRTGTFNALNRLGVARDTSRNWKGNPNGSQQGDVGTMLTWLESIQLGDDAAIDQLVIIDATACERGT